MSNIPHTTLFFSLIVMGTLACGDNDRFDEGDTNPTDPGDTNVADTGSETDPNADRPYRNVYEFVDGCYAVGASVPSDDDSTYLAPTDNGNGFAFGAAEPESASAFFMQASDLATYILYDDGGRYLVGDEDGFARKEEVSSDIFELDDSFQPGVQWEFEVSIRDRTGYQLRHLETGDYLTTDGLTERADRAAVIQFEPAEGCAEYPELTLDATGEVEPRQWDDDSVWGAVETHSHIMSNFAFGGAGMFHGAPFHPLGVEHALPSCEMFHGRQGRKDLFGYGFDRAGGDEVEQEELLSALISGETSEPNHRTAGYPEFTDWPNAHESSTHQVQYYKWMERAYKGGLRLMVQHATSNQIICQLLAGSDIQPTRYSCNEMVAIDRIFEETRNMERYIDAQEGGPGKGWFRIVESPGEAREVINDGKMAVVLGIETSNLFDCFLTPPEGRERCDEEDVVEKLDEYYDKGVRAIFPVHKFDNGFSAGDGHRGVIELGNFAMTAHNSNFVEDCPDVPAAFDQGGLQFGDLNDPREDYLAPPPYDNSTFADAPVETLFDHADTLTGDSLSGDYCMNHGLTDLGEFLIDELMARGMIIEVDHLPQRSYEQAFEILEENDYPAAGTHGTNNDGKIYELGGVSKFNFGTCADPDEPGARAASLNERIEMRKEAGVYPAEGFGFDLNGFAGAPGPRFGDDSDCDTPQEDPVEYPFDSYTGDVTFTEPQVGNRTVDFNTEGLVHIGLIPELIQDVRHTGVTDEELEPLFKSAEAYLRMWEKAERRAENL